jgi:hypothetical protein
MILHRMSPNVALNCRTDFAAVCPELSEKRKRSQSPLDPQRTASPAVLVSPEAVNLSSGHWA